MESLAFVPSCTCSLCAYTFVHTYMTVTCYMYVFQSSFDQLLAFLFCGQFLVKIKHKCVLCCVLLNMHFDFLTLAFLLYLYAHHIKNDKL